MEKSGREELEWTRKQKELLKRNKLGRRRKQKASKVVRRQRIKFGARRLRYVRENFVSVFENNA
jgi:hypothetical protein